MLRGQFRQGIAPDVGRDVGFHNIAVRSIGLGLDGGFHNVG